MTEVKTLLLTSKEWCRRTNTTVLDPDGWDRTNYEYSFNEELISYFTFNLRKCSSTCVLHLRNEP